MDRRRVIVLCSTIALCLLRWPVAGTDDPIGRGSGEDRTGEVATLTVNVVCSASAGRSGAFGGGEKVAINLSETCVYRITSWSDTDVVLARVTNTTNLSADGEAWNSGTIWGAPPTKGSFLARKPVTPVSDVSLDPGSGIGQVYLSEFLKRVKIKSNDKVQDQSLSVALLEMAIMASGKSGQFPNVQIGSGPSLGEQLRFKFKPDDKKFSGHGSCSLSYKQANGEYGEGTIEVNFNFILGSFSSVEAIITPDGDYPSWWPAAATKPGTEKPGNTIKFKVELRDRKTGGPAKGQTAQFEFQLRDTTKEPGSCMNSPWNDADFDLRIRKEDNPQLIDIDKDGQTAKSQEKLTSSPITIACYDGAARAGLIVIAQVRDGDAVSTVTAHLAKDNSDRVALPYDRDGNGIADTWEQKHKVVGKDLETDEDDQPPGDRDNGDGLTIWEEYRGFLEGGKHIRTDPGTKDFFICDTIGGLVQQGIDRFAALTRLAVHGRLKVDELSLGRIINRNRQEDTPHVVDQHGIVIEGVSANGWCMARGGPGTPKSISRVEIDSSIPVERECVGATREKKTYPVFVPIVAHELLHCCNVWHHGQKDKIVFWHSETTKEGTYIYEFESVGDVGYPDRGKILFVVSEQTDTLFVVKDPFWSTPQKIWLGVKRGQHSGSDDCVMRYILSDAYMEGEASHWRHCVIWAPEPVGQKLCLAPDGTGVNAPDHKPYCRYGDADAGRGDCAEKICVNDRYH